MLRVSYRLFEHAVQATDFEKKLILSFPCLFSLFLYIRCQAKLAETFVDGFLPP